MREGGRDGGGEGEGELSSMFVHVHAALPLRRPSALKRKERQR